MHLIDSHAHLSFFTPLQLQKVFEDGASADIREWVLAGYNSIDWAKQKEISLTNKNVRLCFGLHPWQVLEMDGPQIEAELKVLESELQRAHGCGETGIDGFRAKGDADIEKQERVFLRHLELNRKHRLPLVLHIVKSHEKSLEILKKESFTGIVHGYSGSWETAKNYIALGYKISLGRGVFQKGYRHLRETAKNIDLADMVIESDAGLDEKGQPEDPVGILKQVVSALAELKGISAEKICTSNYENVKGLFG